MAACALQSTEIRDVAIRALRRAGAPDDHAQIQTDHLLEAELRGRASHGLLRLPRLVERIHNGVLQPNAKGQHHWQGAALLSVDGQQGFGPVIAYAALEKACLRAKECGIAAVSIQNNNHLGMMALYAEHVAQQGQILLGLSTSEALVHPWGGRHAMIGTNPITIGVPAHPEPFVLDMATSVVAMGTIHDHANRDAPIPSGWALDPNGDPTCDANAAKSGALSPFGQAKGYALGLAFEVLVASLTATTMGTDVVGTLDSEQVCNKGDVFIIITPHMNTSTAAISAYLDAIRACPPIDPDRPVLIPGDRSLAQRQHSLQHGITLAPDIWERIQALASDPISFSPK